MMRMRLIGWEVRPIVMADDGDNLAAVPVNPQTIAPAGWQKFKEGGDDESLAQLRIQIEGEPKPVHNGRVTTRKKAT